MATLLASIVALVLLSTGSLALFPYPLDEPYMIQGYRRNLVWAPLNGELTSGNPIVLSPIDPTDLSQFWISRYISGDIRIFNAAAPDYIVADWDGIEGFNATLKLSKYPNFDNTQLWFSYSLEGEEHFQINAMSGLHWCIRGHDSGLPLILITCNPQDVYPYQRWVYNKNHTLPISTA